MIANMARSFAQDKLAPGAEAREKAGEIELAIRQEMGALGLLGMTVSPDWGGSGADYVSYSLALIEIAAGDGAVSTMMSVQNAPVCEILSRFGNDDQKDQFLRPISQGEMIGAFALTESHAGSDASAIETRADRTETGYILNGAKQFITSGKIAGLIIVFAVTDPNAGKGGISCFVLPANTPGFSVAKTEEKLGQRASDTSSLSFDDVVIPAAYRIGDEGQGYSIALSSLETGRIGIGAQSVGMARAAFDVARKYAFQRESFGKPIFEHQAVAFRLAEMETDLEAATQLVLNAARMRDAGKPCLREACMAKLFASEAAERICSGAIQTLGGYGYLSDFPVERIYRDVRVCQIYEGTSDIQKIIIARQMRD
jgi:hypothetical protein